MATIVTDKGNIVAELYQDTPGGTNNFVTLAQNGFYDGLTFHRVEPGFVIQGGDPAGDGSGGPGYTIPAEINHLHTKGALAWARTGDQINPEQNSSGSQFYVTLDDTPFLDGGYSVFGQVIEGMDVAEKIAVGDKIQKIEISEATASLMPTPEPTAAPNPPVAAEGRPLAKLKLEERSGVYNAAPAVTIDPAKSYAATIETDKGNIVVELDPEDRAGDGQQLRAAVQPGLLRWDAGGACAGGRLSRHRFADQAAGQRCGLHPPGGTDRHSQPGRHGHGQHVPRAGPGHR